MTIPQEERARPRVAVVTGATRGIGELAVRHLAGQGWSVALCGRDAAAAHAVATSLERDHGVVALGAGVDVADADAVGRFVGEVTERLGAPRLVVNNAAVLGPVGDLIDNDLDAWAGALAVNVVGVVNVTAHAARAMVDAGGGAVVMLSGGGIGGPGIAPRLSAYTTSKAALATLVETLSLELAPRGVRVNAVAPGAMPTAFTAGILEAGPEVAGAELFEATERNAAAAGAFDRFAALLDYLASDAGAWLSGRLLSARWETPERLAQDRPTIEHGERFRVRRIDGDLYDALPPR